MSGSDLAAQRAAKIRAAIEAAFKPRALEVIDESHLHRGHAGAKTGKGHFRVHLVSARFEGLALLARHRLIYEAVGTLMETDVHALSIDARTPSEAAS